RPEMSLPDDPAPAPERPTYRVDFAPPGRLSRLAALRCASRLARREVRRRPGRTLLVMALVAVPILAMTAGVVLARTLAVADVGAERRRLGPVADLSIYQQGNGPERDGTLMVSGGGSRQPLANLLPAGSSLLTYTEVYT